MKYRCLTLLLSLLLPSSLLAQEQMTVTPEAVVLSDDTEARFINYNEIQYTRHRSIQVLRDGAMGGAHRDSIITTDTCYYSSNYLYIEPWQPQCELPVRSATYTLITPVGYKLNIQRYGNGNYASRIDTLPSGSEAGTSYKACRRQFEARNLEPFPTEGPFFCPKDYMFKVIPIVTSIEHVDGRLEEHLFFQSRLDLEAYNGPLVQDNFYNPTTPLGARVAGLQQREDVVKVSPVVLRRRSSGRLNQLSYFDGNIYDEVLAAIISDKDTTYVDPRLPDSLMHILPHDLLTNSARLLNISDTSNENNSQQSTGQWVNLFLESDFRVQSNINLSLSPEALLSGSKKVYYRDQAMLEMGRNKDSIYIHEPLKVQADTLSFSSLSLIDFFDQQLPDSLFKLPYEFPYGQNIRYNISIKLPNGYKVRQKPSNSLLIADFQGYACQFNVMTYKDRIDIIYKFIRQKMIQLPSEHRKMYQFYDIIRKKLAEEIVLERTNVTQ